MNKTGGPLAFAFMLLGNSVLAVGPWLVRLADTGPVATGAWRLILAMPFLYFLSRGMGQTPHWPKRTILAMIAGAALFYALDLAAWNAAILRTKLGNSTLFGNTGSIVFAVYGLIIAARTPSPKLQPLPLLLLATLFSIPPLLIISAALGEKMWPDDWTPLLIFALSSQVLGQGMLVYSIGVFPPLVVGLALLTQPIVSATVGWIVFNEMLTATDIIGAAAIAAGLVLVRLPDKGLRLRRPKSS